MLVSLLCGCGFGLNSCLALRGARHMGCCSCHSTFFILYSEGCPGRDRMVVRFTTTYDINAYHH